MNQTKALSFGTGVFLRGFFCDFADRAGIRVTMSSSTPDGDRRAAVMNTAGGRFVLSYRGRETGGQEVDAWRIVETVDRVIPSTDWPETLALAADPDYSLLVSNVSEAGFRRAENLAEDTFERPRSFPARLTRWLHDRWQHLGDSATVTVLPCELFENNGSLLRIMLDQIAEDWQLPEGFIRYLAGGVRIPNTLVDRIVTGEPSPEERESLWNIRLKEEANLPIIVGEPFALWAIEGDAVLSEQIAPLIAASGGQIVVSEDISVYVWKKVRFLNGLHSAMAAIGTVEYDLATVGEAIRHPELGPMLRTALFEEILPAVAPPLDANEAHAYAEATWARFDNPFHRHKLADINKGADAKWPVRLFPTIETYRERFGSDPAILTRCRADWERMRG